MKHCITCGETIEDGHPFSICPECLFREALAVGSLAGETRETPLSCSSAEAAIAEKPGDHIGPYRLLERIGEGGCGVVYQADQLEPIRREVALKIIKLGMDTREVIARFEAERQALALMDHPNIAKVLDAGATATGRPFFVMELVRGISITDYCDKHQLPPARRLKLFLQVCHAIQHAHQKGIIHRDIKPSNILVTSHDHLATLKIIDFGIAKATQQRLTDKTFHTAFAQFIGTPAYMSPEQAGMAGLDIDTRSDVYSLGVLLYELLTGQTPFETGRLLAAGVDEIRRVIREENPPRPSTRLGALDLKRSTLAAKCRQIELPRLITAIRGDLDWIVMRCLEKDRSRRYDTANALAEDIERHLKDEPVSAAAPGVLYQTGKFVRRHRLGFVSASAFITLLITGAAVSTWQAIRATRAERAQTSLLYEAKAARAEADKQRERVEAERKEALAQSARAERERSEAEVRKREAQHQRAEAELQRSNALVALRSAEFERARAEQALAQASNQWMRAETALQEAERLSDFMLFDLSDRLLPIGRADLLRGVTEAVLTHYQSMRSDDESDESLARRYAAFKNLGKVLASQGESTRSLESYRRSLTIAEEMARRSPQANTWHGKIAECHLNLGQFWRSRGDSMLALREFRRGLEIAQLLATEEPGDPEWRRLSYESILYLGETFEARGEGPRALSEYEAALRVARAAARSWPDDLIWQSSTGNCLGRIGTLQLEAGDMTRAMDCCQQSLEIAEQLATQIPADPQLQADLARAHDRSGDMQLARGDTDRALTHYEKAMSVRQQLANTDPDNAQWQRAMLQSYQKMGRVLSQQSRKPQRWEAFVESFLVLGQLPVKQMELTRRFLSPEDLRQKPLEAYRDSVELAKQLAEKDPANLLWKNDLTQSYCLLGDMLIQANEAASALEQYHEALSLRKALACADTNSTVLQFELALCHANVAAALQRLGRKDEAGASARAAFVILAGLASRWPDNLIMMQGLGAGVGGVQGPMIPEQSDALGVVLKQGYSAVEKRAARAPSDLDHQEDLAACCQEMAVYSFLFENVAQALTHAEKAVAVWKYLVQSAPTNTTYGEHLQQAYSSLCVLQLMSDQSASAAQTALRGLALNPESTELNAFLALARLLAGDHEGVRSLLYTHGELEVWSGETFSDAVRDDARGLSAKGVIGLDAAEMEAVFRTGSGAEAR